jgi:hypothetical protein
MQKYNNSITSEELRDLPEYLYFIIPVNTAHCKLKIFGGQL